MVSHYALQPIVVYSKSLALVQTPIFCHLEGSIIRLIIVIMVLGKIRLPFSHYVASLQLSKALP
jgi:hypothetical protein